MGHAREMLLGVNRTLDRQMELFYRMRCYGRVSVFVSRHCCKKRDVMALQYDIHCFVTSYTEASGAAV
jgi:hypothetical protein